MPKTARRKPSLKISTLEREQIKMLYLLGYDYKTSVHKIIGEKRRKKICNLGEIQEIIIRPCLYEQREFENREWDKKLCLNLKNFFKEMKSRRNRHIRDKK